MLNEERLINLFDAHWEQHGEALANKYYKGKKGRDGSLNLKKARKAVESTIGVPNLYSNILISEMGEIVEVKAGRRIMSVTDLSLNGFGVEDKPTIGVIQYYYWPKMIMDEPLDFELKKEGETDLVTAFTKRCMDLRHASRTYEPSEEILGGDQRVNLDIITAINGKPSETHTKRGVWIDIEDLSQAEVKEAVLAAEKGDLVELSFMDEEDEINMFVKIYEVNNIIYKDLDDADLYTSTGHESKDAYFSTFKTNFEANQEQSEKGRAYTAIMNQLMTKSKMEAIPQSWIESNINNFVDRHVQSQGNDLKKAIEVLNVETEQDMKDLFETQVFKETVQQMATLWYADKFDCPVDAQSVASDIHTKVIWV